MNYNLGLISLGCPKNLVDSEIMLGALKEKGFIPVQDLSQADAIIVNTCAFIRDAKEEAIVTILEAAGHKGWPAQGAGGYRLPCGKVP